MFWVDEIVQDILKKIPKSAYLITDWMTTSGHAHIGSLRGLIIHDLIRRGLSENGKKAQFQWGFDDFDPMDGLPSYIDKSWQEHMGKPLCNVPAPDGKSESFAAQYVNEFKRVFNSLDIKPKIVKTSELYKQGRFNEPIKIILDSAPKIRKIYKDISGSDKGDDWFPFNVVCPKCGKIGTTLVTSWDGKMVKFRCEKNLVSWAKGCGFEGEISPFDGNGKLPWKVEWPSKWFIFNTDIEGEGKDHFAAGGSRDIADKIYREIFKKEPPYDIRYEHILVGGAKMSSSKGLGVTAKDMADFLPANLLRFLFVRTRPKRTIDFQAEGETIPLLYDEYDRTVLEYVKDSKSDLGRAYYYTKTDEEIPPQYLPRFSKIAYMLQMPRCNILKYAQEEKARLPSPAAEGNGGYGSKLTAVEVEEIRNRIKVAERWLELYAPENYKFQVQENLPEMVKKLSLKQKEFLTKVNELTKTKDVWQGEELHQEIHHLKNEMKISPREAFAAIYLAFLGKDSGPQAGWLLASLDKNFVLKRLEEVL